MKFFVCIALLAFAFVAVAAKPLETQNAVQSDAAEAAEESPLGSSDAVDASRFRKAAYGASAGYQSSYVSSPPCPNNYLFSCSPNLSPVPCAASGYGQQAAYGQQGAYSAPVPTYVAPYNFMPQNLDAQFYPY